MQKGKLGALMPLKTHRKYFKALEAQILPLIWCGSSKKGCQISCNPHLLIVVKNYELRLDRFRFFSSYESQDKGVKQTINRAESEVFRDKSIRRMEETVPDAEIKLVIDVSK
ncbi:hypothetical protein TNCV_2778061 [Trichonephila clavipes]|nr:hypothetical protein TNCV_2778061 [Trichonephila clavipes]